jgi:hypothetical protein
MAVWILDLPFGQKTEHGPQRMGDGSGLREIGVCEKHADAICLTRNGIVGDLLEFGGSRGVSEDGWFESFLSSRDAEVAKQWSVVHPVHSRVDIGVMYGLAVGGENHEIPFRPLDVLSAGLRATRTLEHEEELARGQRTRCDASIDNPDEIGEQDWWRARGLSSDR